MIVKKSWKNRAGVSPVIATILMVAITVVLAAVLYVMVMGFGGDSGGSAPAVKLSNDGSKVIISCNPATDFDKLKFNVVSGSTTGTVILFSATANATAGSNYAAYVDSGADNKVTNGDYFNVGGSGTLNVYWVNGDTVQLITSIDF